MATARRNLKNLINSYSEAEIDVREATANNAWTPSATLLAKISEATHDRSEGFIKLDQ